MSAETSHLTDIPGGASGTATTQKKPQQAQQAKRVEVAPSSSAPQSAPRAGKPSDQAAWPGMPTLPTMDVVKFFEESRERLREAFDQANGRFDTLRSATREAGDVMQESQAAALAGAKELSEQVFELAQSEVDRGYDCLRAATQAKSVSELMQVQTDYMRETMETQLENAKTFADLATNMVKASFAPLQNGFANVIENARKRS